MKSKKEVKAAEVERLKDNDALIYHEYASMDRDKRLPGKLEVVPSKPCMTQRDLSLAYTPGVASPVMEISKNPERASDYTARSNLVAVVTNGTAVLGLGDVGPLAAKPVMEGKAVLFKRFANINVFDIELNAPTPDDVVKACQMLEPSVGGINLEDIKAPDCFEIERKLTKLLKIPVFHDDQHGTAIIVAAAFINALKLAKKKAESVRVVFSGAGAAAIACANHLLHFGVKRENIYLCDKSGVVHSDRDDLDPFKKAFAHKTSWKRLVDALNGADVFIGLSVGGVVTGEMIKKMSKTPIIFALANPTPEIGYHEAKNARADAIVATGRSDYANQVNNVLGFPSIFRGSLDVEASAINEDMKIAASKALAALAREDVPESVTRVYGGQNFTFGPDYIIPKPFDPRVLLWVAPAVAEAAIKSKVARKVINIDEYREQLALSMDRSRQIITIALERARKKLRRIVLPEGHLPKIMKAAQILIDEKIAHPILLGSKEEIEAVKREHHLHLKGATIIDPETDLQAEEFAQKLYETRQRKGLLLAEAQKLITRKTYYGLMLVSTGKADCLVSGVSKSYPETVRPILQVIPMNRKYKTAAGLYIMLFRDRVLFFADTTVNIEPSAEQLAEIALQSAEMAEFFKIQPRLALISFSNFGSAPHPLNARIQEAVSLIRKARPDLIVDGEMQADTAVSMDRLSEYAFSALKRPANILIFPNLAAGNIAYKLLQRLGQAEVIGPILMGPSKPVHALQQGASVEEIVRMATIAAAEVGAHGETC